MAQKPSIPKGTRDFSPAEMVKRNYIFNSIEQVFKKYGYLPLETPAMETLDTLLGKYGNEGDKLLFKVLNSGDYLKNAPEELLSRRDSASLVTHISEKGLRYDLTVPFARYVVQHRNEINFPFKRYQIQPVWRADRPQKGRYREFYQCDVDVIGSTSQLNELELVQINDEVFRRLGINTITKINNRKVLAGIAGAIGEADKITAITVAIDKLDKIGKDGVYKELHDSGVSGQAISRLEPVLSMEGGNHQKLKAIASVVKDSETGQKGIEELRELLGYLDSLQLNTEIEIDITLARGLNYYTGAIFEVKARDVAIGSICGGGRYDDLTGIFGLKDVSGVGISFGADRIYDVLEQLNVFPEKVEETTRILFVNYGDREQQFILPVVQALRDRGISAEIFPDQVKMKKQMNYANKKGIPFVGIVGEDEYKANKVALKNMETGEQEWVAPDDLFDRLFNA